MLAAIPAAWVTSKKGRKTSMLVASSCYIVGIIIVTAAVHISMLIIGRILLGVGVGFAIQVGVLVRIWDTVLFRWLRLMWKVSSVLCCCDGGCSSLIVSTDVQDEAHPA